MTGNKKEKIWTYTHDCNIFSFLLKKKSEGPTATWAIIKATFAEKTQNLNNLTMSVFMRVLKLLHNQYSICKFHMPNALTV